MLLTHWLWPALTLAGAALAPVTPAAAACLPQGAGFMEFRLQGSIEADLHWREPELECTGMSRPDGQGLRLRFSGPLPGAGRLAIVLAANGVTEGRSARAVPVNVTLMDETGQRIFGTRGDRRCTLDSVEQIPIEGADLPPRSFRVEGRGFCIEPARALDGEGAVLLTRFDFAGRVTYREDEGAAAPDSAGAR